MTFFKKNQLILFILCAFLFSFICRLIWVYQFNGYSPFMFNGEFMINTNDGYYFAEGARDIIAGFHQENDLSPINKALSQFSAILVQILPFSFETTIFYMSAIVSSLIVIPIVLLGKNLANSFVGFCGALLASIAWSYYNRTMIGYYDTDMLNIVFPTFLIWSIILALNTKENKYILFTGFEIIAYRWWYPQSYSIEFAFFSLVFLYIVFLKIKNKDFKYELQLLIAMIIGMLNLAIIIKATLIVALYFIYKRDLPLKILYVLLALVILAFAFTGGLNPIIAQLDVYVSRKDILSQTSDLNLHFFTVMQTIREAGKIPFETFANRISGHTITFIFSIIGYIYLLFKRPIFFISLPLVGLGFLAYGIPGVINGGGLRFTIYAVPVLALGFAFLAFNLSNNFIKGNLPKYVVTLVITAFALYPNIKHIVDYKVPTVFNNIEVQSLDNLKKIASREDYAIGWWDYGYPLRYYADVKTLIDGGKHEGDVNFPVSYILTSPLKQSANMARLDVEYTQRRFNDSNMSSSNIEQMTKDYGFKNTSDFLDSLALDINLPKKTRDIYLYLPQRMMSIYSTVSLFSNLDLMSGVKKPNFTFFQTNSYKDEKNRIILNNNVVIDKTKGSLIINNNQMPINNFIITFYDQKGNLNRQVQSINKQGDLNIIFMRDYNTFLIVDNDVLNSTYFQLFVLENYDKNLFEPVIMNPYVKIYKLKI